MDHVALDMRRSAARRHTPDGGEICTDMFLNVIIYNTLLYAHATGTSLLRPTGLPRFQIMRMHMHGRARTLPFLSYSVR